MLLDISEVARRAGVPASTLRYYDDLGLISSVGRKGLRRLFAPEVIIQLSLISWGKAAGFSLDEIARMFTRAGQPDVPRAELHRKADALEVKIRELTALADMLRHVADCPAPTHMECATFRRLIGRALPDDPDPDETPGPRIRSLS